MAKEHVDDIVSAVGTDCPKIYANGFSAALGIGDVIISFQENGRPAAILNLSFTVAKTFSVKLGTLIQELEKKTDQSIMTTDEILRALGSGEEDGIKETRA
jgi:hypothetical protein